jgi:hypothetical protein
VNSRNSGLRVLVECDPTASAPLLLGLSKDKDKSVAESAKKQLDALKKK